MCILTENNKPTRDLSIDVLRGFAIILVVIGHLNPGIYLTRYIYSFHMFLFFFVSGLVYKRRDVGNFGSFCLKRFLRLVIPFLIWNAIAIVIDCAFISKTFDVILILKQLCFVGGGISWNAPIWFLLVLYFVELIAFFSNRTIWSSAIVFAISTALFIVLSIYQVNLPLGLHLVPVGLIFMSVGILLKPCLYWHKLNDIIRLLLLLFSIAINILLGVVFNETISVYHVIYTNYTFTMLAGILGVVSWFLISYYASKVKLLSIIISKYGTHTLIIVATHYFVLMAIMVLSKRFASVDLWHDVNVWKAIGIGTVILGCYFPVFLLYDRVCKKTNWIKYIF